MQAIVDLDQWTPWQLQMLKDAYRFPRPDLKSLEKIVGKHRANICRKARSLELTNQSRKGLSKYSVSQQAVREFFQEFMASQPITIREFAESKKMWPHSFSLLLKKYGFLEEAKLVVRSRLKRPDFIRKRFEKNFVKQNSCWIWQGARDRSGYGRFNAFGTSKAHRVSYQIYRKAPQRNLLVCHRCDNPPCVNPDHLFMGTSKDNAQDSVRKGRFGKMRYKESVIGSNK